MKRVNGEGSIYYDKTHGRYVVSVSMGRDAETGKIVRKQKTAHSQAEALAMLEALRIKYGKHGAAGKRVKVASYIQFYAETFKKPQVRENTWLNYESLLKHVQRTFADMCFQDLTVTVLQQLVYQLPTENVRHRLVILGRSACRQAMIEGLIRENPFEEIQAAAPRRKKAITILNKDEAIRLLQAAESKPPLYMAILLQYMTGMRAEEVLGLTWDRIDLDNSCLRVEQVTNQVHGQVFLEKPKTEASRRSIFFSGKLKEKLLCYWEWQRTDKKMKLSGWRKPDEVAADFIYTYDGSPKGIHQYASAFRRAALKAHVRATPHALRHTHATQLFLSGWSAKDVQVRLGHSSVSMTLDTYTHYFAQRGEKVAASLDELFPCEEGKFSA